MTLRRRDFAAFFGAVHGDDRAPFAWQARLLDHVVSTRSWPATIDAPTGSGKTAVIDVHVFALALAVATGAPLPPRRLSMVVGRRVLVDDQHRHSVHLREALATPECGTVLAEVAGLLWQLRDLGGQRDRALLPGNSPLVTARLRGGEPPTRMWTDEPNTAAGAVRHSRHVGQPRALPRLRILMAQLATRGRAAGVRLGGGGRRGAPLEAVPDHGTSGR